MKKWLTIAIILLLISAALLGRFMWIAANEVPGSPMTVERDYTGAVGVKRHSRPDYNWFVQKYGEAEKLELLEPEYENWPNRIQAYFGSLTVEFNAYDDELEDSHLWRVDKITTHDPKHRFSIWGVHVGSSREQVQRAYRLTINIQSSEAKDSFVDGEWEDYVDYHYDKNGIVSAITFYWGM